MTKHPAPALRFQDLRKHLSKYLKGVERMEDYSIIIFNEGNVSNSALMEFLLEF